MFETIRSFLEPPITADSEQSTAKLAWVVRLRWVAIAAQLLSIVPALEFRVLEPEMLPLFGAVVATLAVLNVGTWIGLRGGSRGTPGHISIQLGADIIQNTLHQAILQLQSRGLGLPGSHFIMRPGRAGSGGTCPGRDAAGTPVPDLPPHAVKSPHAG